MLKRLLLPLLLLTLALPGCAEKKTHTAELPPEMPFTAIFPPDWKYIPARRVPAEIKNIVVKQDQSLLCAYSASPTAEVRIPFIVVMQSEEGKFSESEMLLSAEAVERVIQEAASGDGKTVTVNDKSFDGQRKKILLDMNVKHRDASTIRILMAMTFTETGSLAAAAYVAPSDAKAVMAIRQIMESMTPVPELQYR